MKKQTKLVLICGIVHKKYNVSLKPKLRQLSMTRYTVPLSMMKESKTKNSIQELPVIEDIVEKEDEIEEPIEPPKMVVNMRSEPLVIRKNGRRVHVWKIDQV